MAWWDKYDLAWVCQYPDHVAYNKGELARLYDNATQGLPGAQQKLDTFAVVDELMFKKLQLIAGCPAPEGVEMPGPIITTEGGLPSFTPLTPEEGYQPSFEEQEEPPLVVDIGAPQPPIVVEAAEPAGQVEAEGPSGVPMVEFGGDTVATIFTVDPSAQPEGALPGASPVGALPGASVYGDAPIPDVGLQTDVGADAAADGALVPEEIIPGLTMPVARPAYPLVWWGALSGATALVVAGAYLLSKIGKR